MENKYDKNFSLSDARDRLISLNAEMYTAKHIVIMSYEELPNRHKTLLPFNKLDDDIKTILSIELQNAIARTICECEEKINDLFK